MKQQEYINFEMSKDGAEMEEYKDLIIIRNDSNSEKPTVKIWKGKQGRPFSNYWFSSLERREQHIETAKQNADGREAYKAQKKAERAAFKADLNIGDIYYSSWGYEQTNIDFYQVVEIKGKSTVVLREICQKQVEDSIYSHGMACEVVAVKDAFLNENTITKRVGQHGISLSSFQSASKWNGQPKYKSWYY